MINLIGRRKSGMTAAICVSLVVMMAGMAQAGPVPITVRGVTGSNGGNWPSWLGHLTDMCNGNLSYDFGVTDHNPAIDISANIYDPATWIFTYSTYQQEWSPNYPGQILDYTTTLNQKILWAVFDFGSVIPAVDRMYIWNRRSNAGTGDTAEYNIYYSSGVGIDALPVMPQSKTSRGDYDFSSGDWTLFNGGGPLTLAQNTANNNTLQTNLVLGGISAQYVAIEILSGGTAAPAKTKAAGLGQVEFTIDDTTPPTLSTTDIADDLVGTSIEAGNPITYTLTFNEDMNPATVTSNDFSNVASGASGIHIDSITHPGGSNIFEIVLTPTSTGNLRLQVSSNVTDLGSNTLTNDVVDVETFSVVTDSTPPEIIGFTDDRNGWMTVINTPITYTVTFDAYMDTNTVTTADFSNAAGSPATITVDSVTPGAIPSIFTVVVTPTALGDIILRIPSGSVRNQANIANSQNLDDPDTITVNDPGLVIYEPFDDPDATLSGNTPGTGLAGTWTASGAVESGSLSHGELITSGNKVILNNQYGGIGTGTTLSLLGLLNDGATLWFSVIIRTGGDVATNGDLGFALGTDRIGSGNNLPISNSGQALGIRFKNNQIRAAYWAPALSASAGSGCSPNTAYLIVGKYEWGATNDTFTVYNVGTDMTLGAASSSYSASVDQSQFDTISFGSKGITVPDYHAFDEIRFGSTYESVIVLPPPAGTLIMIK